ncbi:hypothetical protein [Vreelandella aquamarina]|uniref:hypothetical protein n=1 Tax=Vreelandella aquamarina TaxID=77097 RepID=UPI00385041AD
MKKLWIVPALGIALAACGGKEPIGMNEANEIAALSQDAEIHQEAFAEAIRELSTKEKCSADFMRDYGGFMRVTGERYYFLYCGKPENISRRWYLDPVTGTLTRTDAEL